MTVVDQRRARGARNRAALVDSALELFGSAGYHATTIEQIAERAGVSPRTFANHFRSKEDVLFDGYAERLEDVADHFRLSAAGSLWSAVAEASDAVAESILEDPHRYLERARLYGEVPALRARMLLINEEWIEGIAAAVADRLGTEDPTDVRPRLVAAMVNGSNRTAIDLWVATDGTSDLRSVMRDSLALLRPTIDHLEQPRVEPGARRGR